jgi:hypothetical protein
MLDHDNVFSLNNKNLILHGQKVSSFELSE